MFVFAVGILRKRSDPFKEEALRALTDVTAGVPRTIPLDSRYMSLSLRKKDRIAATPPSVKPSGHMSRSVSPTCGIQIPAGAAHQVR